MTSDSITQRFEDRKKKTRELLEKDPKLLLLADSLKERFNARLLYIESDGMVLGTKQDMGVPVGYYTIQKKKGKQKAVVF